MTVRIATTFALFIGIIAGVFALDLDRHALKTWKDNRYYGFRGIRYAEPPTGSRRFQVINR